MDTYHVICLLTLLSGCLVSVHSNGLFLSVDGEKVGNKLLQQVSATSSIECGCLCETKDLCQSYKAEKVCKNNGPVFKSG